MNVGTTVNDGRLLNYVAYGRMLFYCENGLHLSLMCEVRDPEGVKARAYRASTNIILRGKLSAGHIFNKWHHTLLIISPYCVVQSFPLSAP